MPIKPARGVESIIEKERACSSVVGNLSDFAFRDFSEGHHNFAVVGFDQRFRAFEKLSRPFRCEHDQFKAIVNFLKAIFDGDTRHAPPPLNLEVIQPNFPRGVNVAEHRQGDPRACLQCAEDPEKKTE
jgi:hypothetical protein